MYRLKGFYESQALDFRIDDLLILIGRDASCQIVIDHPAVSRNHALIEMTQTGPVITDQSSDSGTFVNDTRIDPEIRFPIDAGDRVRIGDHEFTVAFEQEPPVDATQALRDQSKRPKGPVRAFEADDDDPASTTQTVPMDSQVLKAQSEMRMSGESSAPSLEIRGADPGTFPVRIGSTELTIGRGKNSQLRLRDRSVSEDHCRIVRRKQRYYLYDANSLNGTFVNGDKIRGGPLCDGDLILIGRVVLRFSDKDSPPSQADHEQVEQKIAALLLAPTRQAPTMKWKFLGLAFLAVIALIGFWIGSGSC